ncbi:MAG: protein kinase [Planctomycetes bacterium]|nr:protein kinase [Planctomycetota bacterium]
MKSETSVVPAADLDLIDEICDEFEASWRRGAMPQIEAYLQRAEESLRGRLWEELVISELACRQLRGERPHSDEYFPRFPERRAHLERLFATTASMREANTTHADAAVIANRQIGGYEVMGEIARGGMGVVYKARQLGLNRTVALKMILAGANAGSEERARFRREAEAAAHLQHPHIVQIFEVGEAERLPFIAMEYLEGGNLANQLDGRPLAARAAAELTETLARAVAYAHERGIIHRDLKPANILLSCVTSSLTDRPSSFVPKVADFGVAKQMHECKDGQTQTGFIMGTPSYMAPEQAAGLAKSVGPATDVYALGAILYEMLTGRRPFQGETALDTLDMVRTQELVPPRRLQPKAPRDLETICMKCLEKEPSKRYLGALALADDLQAFLANRPIVARPLGAAARVWRWCQRKPAVASLAAVLSLVVIGSLIGLSTLWLRAEHFGKIAKEKQKEAEDNLVEAQRHQERAQASYQLARASMEESIKKVAEDPRIKSGPLEDLRRTVLQAETHFYEKFVQLQGDEPDFQEERGRAFTRLGNVTVELASQQKALELYRQAQNILSVLVHDYPSVSKYRAALAANHHQLGNLYTNMGKLEAGEEAYLAALEMEKVLANDHPESFEYKRNLAGTYVNLGLLNYQRLGRSRPTGAKARNELASASEQALSAAAAVLEELGRTHPSNLGSRYPLGAVYINLANTQYEMRRFPKAEESLTMAGTILKDFIDNHPEHEDFVRAQAGLANSFNTLANVCRDANQPQKAEQAFMDALAIQEAMAREHPQILLYAVALGCTQANVGDLIRVNRRKPADSLEWFAKGIATLEPVLAKQPKDLQTRSYLRNAHLGNALALVQLKRYPEALPYFDRTLELDDGRFRQGARLERARTLARVKEHARATAEAESLIEPMNVSFGTLYGAATVYALAAAAISEDGPLAERYGVRAVTLLRQARAAGFTDVRRLKTDAHLDGLRSREDFKNLLAEAENHEGPAVKGDRQ